MSKVVIIFYNARKLNDLIQCAVLNEKINAIDCPNSLDGIIVANKNNVRVVNNASLSITSDSLLLLPDNFNISWNEVLKSINYQYKVLYHTRTEEFYNTMKIICEIICRENCKGYERQMEERNTAYELIGKYCDNNSKITFDDIWKAIKDVDVLLRAKNDFIEQLADTTIPMPEIPQILEKIIKNYDASVDANREKEFIEIRKQLFGE